MINHAASMKNKRFYVSIIFIALIISYFILFFYAPLDPDRSFIYSDFDKYYYSMKYHQSSWMQKGIIPFWNPHLYCGQPFHAALQGSLFYPFSAILCFFDHGLGLTYLVCLHYLIAFINFYVLMRYWKISVAGAVFASIIFVFNGCTLSLHSYVDYLQTYIWLPLLLLFTDRLMKHPSVRGVFLVVLPLSLQIVAGNSECTFYSLIIVSLYAVTGIPVDRLTYVRAVLMFFLALIITGLLTAGQLLPTAELTAHSSRIELVNSNDSAAFSYSPIDYISAVIAKMYYDPLTQTAWAHIFQELRLFWFQSLYVGILPLLFALVSYTRREKHKILFFIFLAVFSVVMSLGPATPVYPWLREHVSLLRYFQYPGKWALFFTFCISILAGFGWQRLFGTPSYTSVFRRTKIMFMTICALLFPLPVILFVFRDRIIPYFLFSLKNIAPDTLPESDISRYIIDLQVPILILVTGIALCIIVGVCLPRYKGLAGTLVIFYLCINFYTATKPLLVTVESEFYIKPPFLADILKQFWSTFRILDTPVHYKFPRIIAKHRIDKVYLASNTGALYGVEYVGGTMALPIKETTDVLQALSKEPLVIQNRKLDILNMQYIIAQNQLPADVYPMRYSLIGKPPYLFENPSGLPRFFMTKSIVAVADSKGFFDRLADPDFDFSRTCITNVADPQHLMMHNTKGEPPQHIDPESPPFGFFFPDCNRALVEFYQPVSGYLVWSDTYDPGWKAYLDGVLTSSGRVNHCMKGVFIDRDDEKIEWIYQPYSIVLGIYISLLMLMIILFCFSLAIPYF